MQRVKGLPSMSWGRGGDGGWEPVGNEMVGEKEVGLPHIAEEEDDCQGTSESAMCLVRPCTNWELGAM